MLVSMGLIDDVGEFIEVSVCLIVESVFENGMGVIEFCGFDCSFWIVVEVYLVI